MQALVRRLHRLLPIAAPDPKIVKAKRGQVVLQQIRIETILVEGEPSAGSCGCDCGRD